MANELHFDESGFLGLSGSLRALAASVDEAFLDIAFNLDAEEQEFLPLLPVRELRKIDYFSSFPHLVTFPASVDDDPAHLHEFARANSAECDGPLHVGHLNEATAVLAPAACYAVYIALKGRRINTPRRITVKGTCFRAEQSFEPLVRQPSFRMREIVHIGERATIESFLDRARSQVVLLAGAFGIATKLEKATDPFFDPARSPKYVHAKLFPTKTELVASGVAIASFNDHRNFFGDAFDIATPAGPAHSACVAFGLERWVHAIVATHGPNPAAWPLQAAPCSR
jgi:hypothetical protein